MILILQIAAGIVLGFLVLQNLPRIRQFLIKVLQGPAGAPLVWGTIIGIAVWMGWVPTAVLEVVGALLAGLAGAALLMVAIQYSARGLGYLYVWQRARIASSRCWTNLLRVIGVHPSWHTTDLPRAEIAIEVGDALFIGLGRFLALCSFALVTVLFIAIAPSFGVLATVVGVSLQVTGMFMLLRMGRRWREHAPDSETPPGC